MVDFWKPPSLVNETVDFMVNSKFRDKLHQFLDEHSIDYNIIIDDVHQFYAIALSYLQQIDELTPRQAILFGNQRRFQDESSSKLDLVMGEYHSYDAIVWWLKSLEERFPEIVEVISIGITAEGRNIFGAKLGTKNVNKTGVIWIDAGIHAREWASVHTALYFIKKLVTDYFIDPKTTEYFELLDIYIYPCLNPDGYEYTRSAPNDPSVRLWRKNRGLGEQCERRDGKERCCRGVDLNRNFAFYFAVSQCYFKRFLVMNVTFSIPETGSSYSPCSEIYHGKYAFSEKETRAVRDAVLSLRHRMKSYITLHTYSQLWVYPYSNKRFAYSDDVDDLKAVAKQAVESLRRLYGTKYRYGTGPEIIYAYSGGSADWAKKTARVKYSYTIELRPSYFCTLLLNEVSNIAAWNGFVLDKRQLIPTGRETYEGVKVVIDKVIAESRHRGMYILISNFI
ncbi:unnamed protein product [Thelazia callipaeda]|uniref:Peptidase_M14 domain-containing protein n=1 Tax=Thelazia callipaeda TaxID=103827 RepID=A0A0N5CJU4_THECL|nr:unnamed protein product [Thelazia callipaeda]